MWLQYYSVRTWGLIIWIKLEKIVMLSTWIECVYKLHREFSSPAQSSTEHAHYFFLSGCNVRNERLFNSVYDIIQRSRFLMPSPTFAESSHYVILKSATHPDFRWKKTLSRIPVTGNTQDNYTACWCKMTGSSTWRTGSYSVGLTWSSVGLETRKLKRKCCS